MFLLSMLTAFQMRMDAVLNDEEGQGLAEYALILVFVAILAIVALKLLGGNISSTLNSVANSL